MENKDIASRYLFVDMAIKNLELDLQHIQNGQFKIKEPYIKLIEKTISEAINERRHLKGLIHQQRIQVLFMHRQGDFTTYKFILGGLEQEVTFHNMVIKKNVESIMGELMSMTS
jgi:hypothetical protein